MSLRVIGQTVAGRADPASVGSKNSHVHVRHELHCHQLKSQGNGFTVRDTGLDTRARSAPELGSQILLQRVSARVCPLRRGNDDLGDTDSVMLT